MDAEQIAVASTLPSKRYYVYVLKYPDGRPFYIGKGTGGRVMDHAREAHSTCICLRCEVIRSIWRIPDVVHYEIVFESDSDVEAHVKEAQMIYDLSSPFLVNKAWVDSSKLARP